MFKSFLLKQMLKSKLSALPEAERDRILNVIEKNPELFIKIAGEIKAKTDVGQEQMSSAMEVMKSHEDELRKVSL